MEQPAATPVPQPKRRGRLARLWKAMNSRSEKSYKLSMLVLRSIQTTLAALSMILLAVICIQRKHESNGLVYLGMIILFIVNGIEIVALRRPSYVVHRRRIFTLAFFDLAAAGLLAPGAMLEAMYLDMSQFGPNRPKHKENPLRTPTSVLLIYVGLVQIQLALSDFSGFLIREDKEDDQGEQEVGERAAVTTGSEMANNPGNAV